MITPQGVSLGIKKFSSHPRPK